MPYALRQRVLLGYGALTTLARFPPLSLTHARKGEVNMDWTEATIRKLFAALPASGYDIGIIGDAGMYRLEAVPVLRILRCSLISSTATPTAHIFTSDPPAEFL